ncbi:DNA polymerase [Aspergillus sclerotialis]|uniref:DNA-directed DNA polymerase n=1 Tax=Aspergillus sclerotialis TaxID=2070753 RepID=A0A3A2ZYG7_9EURO|nr:DNA polymerase [Aspergillus sclerotialis]
MTTDNTDYGFLRPPSDEEHAPIHRETPHYNPLHTFRLPTGQDRHYQQQYGDMYFLRLARLKPAVEQVATEVWEGFSIAGEQARRVERVLDVRQGELCWVAGTIYMDMPLKPNILDDLTRENYTLAPPPRKTYQDPSNPSLTQVMLEDESGRLRLTGTLLRTTQLATGAIVAALGTENSNGDFEVIDIKVPDLPRQPARWERDSQSTEKKESPGKSKIAFVSGLGITGTSSDTLALELLTDYLLGYTGTSTETNTDTETNNLPPASSISRLIIAGNSLGASVTAEAATSSNPNHQAPKKKTGPKKYGYDASAYNPSPITHFDSFLSEILPSIPVTLMPGETDPANYSLPQQGIHRAMLPRARAYCAGPTPPDQEPEPGWLDSVTNPWEGDVEGWRLWGTSGQNVDDVLRYLDFAEDMPGGDINEDEDSEARLKIMEAMLRWRCGVPTAPDTLSVIEGDSPLRLNGADADTDAEMTDIMAQEESATKVRLLALPKFCETGELVLVDSETLEPEVVRFGVFEKSRKEDR